MKYLFQFFIFLPLIITAAQAELKLISNEVSLKKLSPPELKLYHAFIADTLSHLPPLMAQNLGEVNLEFSPLKTKLKPFDCSKSNPGQDSLAFTKKTSSKVSITLHVDLLEMIVDKNKGDVSTNCIHSTNYEMVKATLLHELGHAWDLLPESANTKALSQGKKVDRFSSYNISSRSSFQAVFKSIIKDTKHLRSPDLYEFSDLHEAFAVNLEYFLLDSEYKCRRPSLYKYLSELLNVDPSKEKDCEYPTVRVGNLSNGQSFFSKIDPARIYQVHYLLAAPGKAAVSRWGHSMIRIVMCAPFRKEKSADCLNDIADHIVLSFRASITDLRMNYMSGFTGAYPSIMFMYSMAEVIDDYGIGENRELFSVPVKMNESELEFFSHKVNELYWQYSGSYKFVSNNCATETLDFFKGLFYQSTLATINDKLVTPIEVLERLKDTGKVLEKDLDKLRKEKKGVYYFVPYIEHARKAYEVLVKAQLISMKSNLEKMIVNQVPSERLALMKKAKTLPPEARKKISAALMTIEDLYRRKLEKLLETKILENFVNSASAQTKEEMTNIFGLVIKMMPQNIAPKGYGIPLSNESLSIEDQYLLYKEMEEAKNNFLPQIKLEMAEEMKNLIQESIKDRQIYLNEFKGQ